MLTLWQGWPCQIFWTTCQLDGLLLRAASERYVSLEEKRGLKEVGTGWDGRGSTEISQVTHFLKLVLKDYWTGSVCLFVFLMQVLDSLQTDPDIGQKSCRESYMHDSLSHMACVHKTQRCLSTNA